MLYDPFHEDRVGRPILPIYRFAQTLKARGCRLSWGSGTERERDYFQCAQDPDVCRKEIDLEDIEAGRVLR